MPYGRHNGLVLKALPFLVRALTQLAATPQSDQYAAIGDSSLTSGNSSPYPPEALRQSLTAWMNGAVGLRRGVGSRRDPGQTPPLPSATLVPRTGLVVGITTAAVIADGASGDRCIV